MIFYLEIFFLTLFLTIVFTLAVKKIALKFNIVDLPEKKAWAVHKRETPLLGGVAIFLAYFMVLFLFQDKILAGNLEPRHWLGFFAGGCFLIVGGFLDDKYNLKPSRQIIWPILAAIALILGGVNIEKITNPLGGFFYLGTMVSGLLIFIWLIAMMYSTKLLDGLDGLAVGVTMVGAFIIFLFTTTTKYFQSDISLASLILASACLGFLIFNWHPAKIFLGEGGSLFLGYALGVLAIISGGKIAIALLVMGIPVLDLFWTIIRRLADKKNPFKFADKLHLHHRLMRSGLGYRRTVLIFYSLSLIFGLSGLFLQSKGKIFALSILFLVMLFLVIALKYRLNKK